MTVRNVGFLAAAALIALAAGAYADPIEVRTSRIPLYPDRPNDMRAGSLEYRGGLVLSSEDKRFGGWSDLAVSSDGKRLLGLSDEGSWLRATLSYDKTGNLSDVSGADIRPLLDMDGKPVTGANRDSEGLGLEHAGDLNGPVVVSFENNVRIWRYDFSKGLHARPENVAIGRWVHQLRGNRQLEAVSIIRPDTLITFGEAPVHPGEDLRAALESYPGDGQPHTRLLSVVPNDPFYVTGAANAPNGGLFLLERRFSLMGGVGFEIRHIAADEIKEGARLKGKVLVNLTFLDANIDNMEGIAVRRGPGGETLLYVISDDNFFQLQRTLLLMFELKPGK